MRSRLYNDVGKAALRLPSRIQPFMIASESGTVRVRPSFPVAIAFAVFSLVLPDALLAQENAPGPLTPPPEHEVKRITGVPQPEAPPSLAPAQIIQAFAKKEESYVAARPLFSYRKTIRIQEFGPDGHPSGEFIATYEAARSSDGQIYEKALSAPASNLQYLQFEPQDAQFLTRIPAFPVTTSQLSKYNVQYLNTEQVDEVDCYIFQVSPKTLDRQHALFDGVIWVDQKFLEVVKTYGKWITDLGPVKSPTLPFDMFETYRENVEGKYWFPNYARAEGIYKMKDHDIPIRVTIKWSDFKPFPPSAATPAAPPATTTPAQPATPSTSPAPPAPKPES
ncbi:MAG TPA: hypothetical protein VMH31_15945 [Methylomirabilota bacterium]|nr:hypothetical protein [Methylomirabilota bacterium]